MIWISVILALSVPGVVLAGYCLRKGDGRGIGWQFIRYTVLGITLPIVGLLALNGALTGEAATLIGGAMGFVFGKATEDTKPGSGS